MPLMKDLLNNLVASQHALETATTREATQHTLINILAFCFQCNCQVVLSAERWLDSRLCCRRIDCDARRRRHQRHLAIPLVDEEGVQVLSTLPRRTARQSGNRGSTGLLRIATDTLKRLSWRATPIRSGNWLRTPMSLST